MRRKHRRQSSVGVSIRSEGRESQRRRSSYTYSSWIRDADDEADELSTRTGRSRPCSWGPIGEVFYRDSLSFCDSERSPMSHHECNFQKIAHLWCANKKKFASVQLYNIKTHTHTQQFILEKIVKIEAFFWFSHFIRFKMSLMSSLYLYIGLKHRRASRQPRRVYTVKILTFYF